jgi:predicted ester cyclase
VRVLAGALRRRQRILITAEAGVQHGLRPLKQGRRDSFPPAHQIPGDARDQLEGLTFDSYFDSENFAFHGPDGFDSAYAGLTEYFQSIRAAFEDRTIRRGIIVAEGDLIACQTWIEGTFTGPFTHSPLGKLEPNGARVVWDLMSMVRFDDRGRLVEEFVRTDNRSFLRQLGPEVA